MDDHTNALLKIGEFSRLSQVTVKTLRHYDELDLLKPAHIDPFTNYRYYSVDQLPHIHRIMALKEMGLSLDQIRLLLQEALPIEQIRGMLRLRQNEIQQRVREEQMRLSMVEFRLRLLEAEINFPEMDVVIKQVEPMRALSIFVGWDQEKVPFIRAIHQAMQAGRFELAGKVADVFHGDELIRFESPDLRDDQHQILLPVGEDHNDDVALEGIGILKLCQVPAMMTAASLMLRGPDYEPVVLLQRWAVAHGHELLSQVRFVHHRGPLEIPDRSQWVTEVQLAVQAAG